MRNVIIVGKLLRKQVNGNERTVRREIKYWFEVEI